MPFLAKDVRRFKSKFVRGGEDECWEFQGCPSGDGYGQVMLGGKMHKAHRVSYTLYVGVIPQGEGYHGTCVCHTCDNKLCVNPKHLFLGTNYDNVQDMVSKGRQGAARGESSGKHKLTECEVIEMRERYWNGATKISTRKLAKEYDISPAQVQVIVTGKQWQHLL